ncbi:hypothetical protein PoB_005329700 [Plakobranchus ocellatus]|uniref:Uncharacterized protein n=1 Tax=Plakobranchus ocellatus TaxID=259542 RepID=A0AAV4C6A2_9GAST|nr:hypothetical protein PoB_005329700 [Plakobranchus ocellatus]
MVLSALTVCCEEISCLKTFVDRQTAQTERQTDRRYASVHGFLLTAPVVMDIPENPKPIGVSLVSTAHLLLCDFPSNVISKALAFNKAEDDIELKLSTNCPVHFRVTALATAL